MLYNFHFIEVQYCIIIRGAKYTIFIYTVFIPPKPDKLSSLHLALR